VENTMSDWLAIGMMMGVGLANMAIYFAWSKWLDERTDAIVSGLVAGVPVSLQHRWIILQESWMRSMALVLSSELVLSAGFAAIGRAADAEEVKLYAYLNAVIYFFPIAIGGIPYSVLSYQRLRSVLREATQD